MSVSNTTYQNSYTGDGSTTQFAFTWRLTDASQVQVYLNSVLQNTGYTLSLNLNGIGGTVTFTSAPANGVTVLIQRLSDLLQTNTFTGSQTIPPSTIETMVDKLTLICQQLYNSLASYIGLQSTINPSTYTLQFGAPQPNQVFQWDSTGKILQLVSVATMIANALPTSGAGNVLGPNPSTQHGIALYGNTTGNVLEDLGSLGTSGQVLTSNGPGMKPGWASPAASLIVPNSGRLSLQTGTPVPPADVTAATILYRSCGLTTLWNGSAWVTSQDQERSISLSGLTASLPYAVYEYLNGSTPTLELQAWTNTTTRATALTQDTNSGLWYKSSDKTRAWKGDILITSVTGQAEDSSKFRGVFNAYNRVQRWLYAHDTTASWSCASAGYRSFNGNTTLGTGKATAFVGSADAFAFIEVSQILAPPVGSTQTDTVGLGVNSTSTSSAKIADLFEASSAASTDLRFLKAELFGYLTLGENDFYPLEKQVTGNATTMYGNGAGTAQSGLIGFVVM
jgi:hypothetical protein